MEVGGGKLSHTLHRAFDLCRDPMEGLETAVALGFDTILTSGQQAKAVDGIGLLRDLNQRAGERIAILAGSGVTPENMPLLHRETGIRQFHFSAKVTRPSPMVFRRPGVPMGLPLADEYERTCADAETVARAKAVLLGLF